MKFHNSIGLINFWGKLGDEGFIGALKRKFKVVN